MLILCLFFWWYFHSDAFTEDDWKLVQLVLTLFRNILAIQEIPLQQKLGGSTSQLLSLRDGFQELLFRENVMDIVLVITHYVETYFRQDNLLLLEIFHYIFMGQVPELIAKVHQKVSFLDIFFFYFTCFFFRKISYLRVLCQAGKKHMNN